MDNNIYNDGYWVVKLDCMDEIFQIQQIIKQIFFCEPEELHKLNISHDSYLELVNKTKNTIIDKQIIKKMLLRNSVYLTSLLGPDLDIQSDIHLRVSRPTVQEDLVGWHRDTFYGNSYWEINLWFPIYPLDDGAGLMLLEGSHHIPSKNIRALSDDSKLSKNPEKGSLANRIGYPYLPKTDDVISELDINKVKILKPNVGEVVFFFGYMVHKAQNFSSKTRVSIDLRIKNHFTPTNTARGYYQPLLRSEVGECIEKMASLNEEIT